MEFIGGHFRTGRRRGIGIPRGGLICMTLVILGTFVSRGIVADDFLVYYFFEELPANAQVGDLINDFGFKSRYNNTVLDLLRFTFLMQPSADRQYISIDETTGVIRSVSKVDREKVCPKSDDCVIKFDVAVKPIQFFQIIKVKVEILDTNDNTPTFPEKILYHQMSEAAEIGSGFVVPAATDLDSTKYGIQNYALFPINDIFELKVIIINYSFYVLFYIDLRGNASSK